jgi:hypothetical protein
MKKFQASTKYHFFRFLIWRALPPDGWDHFKKKKVSPLQGEGVVWCREVGRFSTNNLPFLDSIQNESLSTTVNYNAHLSNDPRFQVILCINYKEKFQRKPVAFFYTGNDSSEKLNRRVSMCSTEIVKTHRANLHPHPSRTTDISLQFFPFCCTLLNNSLVPKHYPMTSLDTSL